jgi:superfamily II DNA or RNA helicase
MTKDAASQYSLPNVSLYPWQRDCLSRWFENGCRGIVRVATGAGKTMLALAAARHLAARGPAETLKVKIVVPKVFLAAQWRADIMEFLGVPRGDIGLYCGAIKEGGGKPFMIYVLNTARLCVSRHILNDVNDGASVLLVCDECHHFGSAENAHVFDFLPHIPKERFFSLGLSATPDCENYNEVIVPALGKEIYRYDMTEATRDRIVADCTLFYAAVGFTDEERYDYEAFSDKIARIMSKLMQRRSVFANTPPNMFFQRLMRLQRQGDETGDLARALLLCFYRRKELVHKARMRLDCGAEIVRRLMPDHRTIVFTERIETADILFDMLCAAFPGRIERYHSQMRAEEKARALFRYRNGESGVIVCCRALDEGLNVPETDAGVILSVGGNARQRIQRVGRILRRGAEARPKKIYYLHIPESAEADTLLPLEDAARGTPGPEPFEDAYNLWWTESGELLPDPAYAALAERVRANLRQSGASERQLRKAERQLDRGCVRTDFLLPASACLALLEQARADERDYLIIMLLMAREMERTKEETKGEETKGDGSFVRK